METIQLKEPNCHAQQYPRKKKDIRVFGGKTKFTRVDNILFDEVIPMLSGSAWKLLSIIIRKTWGYGKDSAVLSYATLKEGTGINAGETVASAIRELLGEDIHGNRVGIPFIMRCSGMEKYDATSYSLNKSLRISKGEMKPRNGQLQASSSTRIRRDVQAKNCPKSQAENPPACQAENRTEPQAENRTVQKKERIKEKEKKGNFQGSEVSFKVEIDYETVFPGTKDKVEPQQYSDEEEKMIKMFTDFVSMDERDQKCNMGSQMARLLLQEEHLGPNELQRFIDSWKGICRRKGLPVHRRLTPYEAYKEMKKFYSDCSVRESSAPCQFSSS